MQIMFLLENNFIFEHKFRTTGSKFLLPSHVLSYLLRKFATKLERDNIANLFQIFRPKNIILYFTSDDVHNQCRRHCVLTKPSMIRGEKIAFALYRSFHSSF